MMPDITLINQPIGRKRLKEIAQQLFGDMVKGVVDIEKKIMALGGELHADEEAFLMGQGSEQKNLWGINLYPDLEMPEMLEFDSVINIRPSQGNTDTSREIARLREEVCRELFADEINAASVQQLQRYFLAFAIAARNRARW